MTVPTYCQIDGEDFVNFCGLLRKRELKSEFPTSNSNLKRTLMYLLATPHRHHLLFYNVINRCNNFCSFWNWWRLHEFSLQYQVKWKEYETNPNFLQLSQKLTTDSLLICFSTNPKRDFSAVLISSFRFATRIKQVLLKVS